MRTAAICPTCATYTNAVCVIYDGPAMLANIPASPLDDLDTILVALNITLGDINDDIATIQSDIITINNALSSLPTPVGTVTSVQLASGTGISLSGTNPITTTGTITVTNSAPDQIVTLATTGTGLAVTGTYPAFTIQNTLPDQTVTLLPGTGINTSGTYPNFTITNTAPDQVVSIASGEGISVSGTYPSFTVNRSYKVYTAVISQSGTSAPTEDYILENTLGFVPTWSYSNIGRYEINGPIGAWPSSKVVVFINPGYPALGVITGWERNSQFIITIHTEANSPVDPNNPWANNLLSKATIEIRVYP